MDKQGKGKKQSQGRISSEKLDILSTMCDQPNSTDVLGSYTGTSAGDKHPVQDADDL